MLDATAAVLRRRWLTILIKELRNEVQQRHISDTNTLWQSIGGSSGLNSMELHYRMYGAFVDMNVGRGRGKEKNRETAMVNKLYAQMQGKRGGRRAKRHGWYSKRMTREQKRLAELLSELYADAGADAIVNAIPLRIELLM